MPPLLMKLVFTALPARAPGLMKWLVKSIAARAQKGFVDPQLKAHIDYWEAELAKSTWFAGAELTGADIRMSFPLEAAAQRAGAADRPRIKAFLDRIHARPVGDSQTSAQIVGILRMVNREQQWRCRAPDQLRA
jgi:glutathione S-transferase